MKYVLRWIVLLLVAGMARAGETVQLDTGNATMTTLSSTWRSSSLQSARTMPCLSSKRKTNRELSNTTR